MAELDVLAARGDGREIWNPQRGGLVRRHERAARAYRQYNQTAKADAGLMVFLCGPDAADITGAAIPIDGGWSIS